MKNYRNSDWAANKYSRGIVYRFADGTVEVTLADYLRENPDKTEKDFAAIKAVSDELFLEQVRGDNVQSKHTIPLCSIAETARCYAPTPEEQSAYTERVCLAKAALDVLTSAQRRRYLLHKLHGMTTREIAETEGVSQRSVMGSLELAARKINKFLAAA
jgi:DNA-directed RNA polymerase specialized sigma24 family protein